MLNRTPLFLLFAASAGSGLAQLPEIAQNGVLNAASWSAPVSPGALAAVFGKNLASNQQAATPPYPDTLAGTSVNVNGFAAPLLFVSPGQINFQMPSAVKNSEWFNVTTAQIVVTTSAGSSAPVTFGVSSMPGLFTVDGSGCGQAAALNIRPDGTVSINSATNSAAPGDYVALYGTGFGFSPNQPPDGTAATGIAPLESTPGLSLDRGSTTAAPDYAGLAPTLVGVDQINFRLPETTRNGCAVPVIASQGLSSLPVTIAVQQGRGQCVDPPIQSYGQISLSRWTATMPNTNQTTTAENFSAIFLAGPALKAPSTQQPIVFAPAFTSTSGTAVADLVSASGFIRECPVPGYSDLSAGAIQIQPPAGSAVTVTPFSSIEGVTYGESLPAGFIGGGTYTISGAPGNAVSLNTTVQVGSPIQLQTSFAPGTVISQSRPLTVKWTGGDANSLVRVTLSSTQAITSYAHAMDGTMTIQPICASPSSGNAASCGFGLPNSSSAQLNVSLVPAEAQVITAPGITGAVQVNWSYIYSFAGLTLAP